ncbi:MAG TPA: antibiotic biosynthesis monooxygenase family protein [Pseudonocardia sp.]|nr:antibiotic biosynthesis monooxygenase family protein [Pseudonocardia sp.]
MAVTVVLQVPAQPGKGAELAKSFEDILPDTRAYKGCNGVTVHEDASDPDKLILIEHWDSAEDHTAYSNWRKDSGTLGGVMGLAAGRPVTTVYNDLS